MLTCTILDYYFCPFQSLDLKIGREEKGVSGVTFFFWGGGEVLPTRTLQHLQTINLLHRHIDPCKSSVLIFKMKYNLGSRRTFINNVFNTRQDKLLGWQICDLETAWLAFISMSLEKENFLRICVQSSNHTDLVYTRICHS